MEISTGDLPAAGSRRCELCGAAAEWHLTTWLAAPWPHYVKGWLCNDCRFRVVPGLIVHKIAHQCVPEAAMLG